MVLKHGLEKVVELVHEGVLNPTEAKVFQIEELAEAHEFLEGRKSIGKVSVKW